MKPQLTFLQIHDLCDKIIEVTKYVRRDQNKFAFLFFCNDLFFQ